jgi:hypothetical protein
LVSALDELRLPEPATTVKFTVTPVFGTPLFITRAVRGTATVAPCAIERYGVVQQTTQLTDVEYRLVRVLGGVLGLDLAVDHHQSMLKAGGEPVVELQRAPEMFLRR